MAYPDDTATTEQEPAKASAFATADELKRWHGEAVRFKQQWRPEALENEGMVHGYQWTKEEEDDLEKQGRKAVKSPHIAKVIWAMCGFRVQNKYEIKCLPVGASDQGTAQARTLLMKHAWDQNHVEYTQSDVALNQYQGPMGWFYVGTQDEDPSRDPIVIEYVPWDEMAWDPARKRLDMRDCKTVTRQRWTALDDAKQAYPKHADALERFASRCRDDKSSGQASVGKGGDDVGSVLTWGDSDYYYEGRKEVRLVECWYRKSEPTHYLALPDGRTVEFDAKSQDHQMAYMQAPDSVKEGTISRIYMATFCGDVILEERRSHWKHNHFPYVPMWGLVDQRGYPYGIVRLIADEQRVINWTTSKLLWIGASRQAFVNDGADIEGVAENLAKPNGLVPRHSADEVEIIPQGDMAGLNEALLQNALNNIKEIAGSPAESRGQDGQKTSGKAILATQDAALRQQGRFLDNEQRALIVIGEILNALFDQVYTDEKIIRITEADGKQVQVAINVQDPLRRAELEKAGMQVCGPISQGAYDVTVATAPLSTTQREALVEQASQLLQGVDPVTRTGLMDLWFGLSDFPNKEEWIARIQQMQQAQGIGAPQQPSLEQQQMQQAQMQGQMQMMGAEVQTKQAGAQKAEAEAQQAQLDVIGKQQELQHGGGMAEQKMRHAEEQHGQRMGGLGQ